jgi:histidine triad (HIT) family protein
MNCLFCEIVAGNLTASIVHRDELCTAFLDIQPVNPGHLLIVPNLHAADLSELDSDTGAHIFKIAQRLSNVLRKSGVQCEGVNLFLADGEAAMQEVYHFHLHVFPRFAGDGFGLKFGPAYFEKPTRAELDATKKN